MTRNPSPVESVEAMPRYCTACGRPLVIEDRTVGFDPRTGAPRLRAYGFCRRSWVERLLVDDEDSGHDRYIVMPRPLIPENSDDE
jgi:hypothetical protein